MFRIEDTGIGIARDQVPRLNAAFAGPVPDVNESTARHTGFPVVHRIARKHSIGVRFASRRAPGHRHARDGDPPAAAALRDRGGRLAAPSCRRRAVSALARGDGGSGSAPPRAGRSDGERIGRDRIGAGVVGDHLGTGSTDTGGTAGARASRGDVADGSAPRSRTAAGRAPPRRRARGSAPRGGTARGSAPRGGTARGSAPRSRIAGRRADRARIAAGPADRGRAAGGGVDGAGPRPGRASRRATAPGTAECARRRAEAGRGRRAIASRSRRRPGGPSPTTSARSPRASRTPSPPVASPAASSARCSTVPRSRKARSHEQPDRIAAQ